MTPLTSQLFAENEGDLGKDGEKEWKKIIWATDHRGELSAYFKFIARERETAAVDIDSVPYYGTNGGLYRKLSFVDIIAVWNVLRDGYASTREDLFAAAQAALPNQSPERIQLVIDLVIRLVLLARVEFVDGNFYASYRSLPFPAGQSLADTLRVLNNQSAQSRQAPGPGWEEFPSWFNVVDLEKKTGLRIQWTSYLTDHLDIRNGVVYLLNNDQALDQMAKSSQICPRFFSDDFLRQTRMSIKLFFPIDVYPIESKYPAWFKSHNRGSGDGSMLKWQTNLMSDCRANKCSRLVSDHSIWRERLLRISKTTARSGSFTKRLMRLWHDDRDETLWWTRWAVVWAFLLAIFFGLIQSVTGIIQVVYAIRGSSGTGN